MITVLNHYAAEPVEVDGVLKSREVFVFAGLSSDDKPVGMYLEKTMIANGSAFEEINTGKSYVYDEENAEWCQQDMSTASRGGADAGAQSLADVLEYAISSQVKQGRVVSLTATEFASGEVIETVGTPIYVSDVSEFTAYGLIDAGWYIFARITPKDGSVVTEQTSVEGGAGHILTAGAGHIDVAVKFEVAAMSQKVTIDWGTYSESFVFKSTDLAVRNLDYRSTYYVYDVDPYATWTYTLTTDTAFATNGHYYTKDGDVYTEATVTAGEAIPADTYYVHSKLILSGMTRNVTYKLDKLVDCPIEIVLPDIDDGDSYGAWFDFQFRHKSAYSVTLTPPTGVKIATNNTPNPTGGINLLHLHYAYIDDVKVWSALNTHTDFNA